MSLHWQLILLQLQGCHCVLQLAFVKLQKFVCSGLSFNQLALIHNNERPSEICKSFVPNAFRILFHLIKLVIIMVEADDGVLSSAFEAVPETLNFCLSCHLISCIAAAIELLE
jgi:hypothetical protein